MPRWAVDAAVRRGELVTLFPRAYVRPWDLDDPFVRLAAGLASVGGDAALSHPSALTVWELLKPDAFRPVHVTTEDGRHTRGQQGDLVVHRKPSLPPTSVRGGLTVLRPEWAITDSWPMLQGYDKRAPAITAVRNRITTPDRIADAAPPNLPGRAALLDLLAMVADGCHSELEVWGYREVFNIPD